MRNLSLRIKCGSQKLIPHSFVRTCKSNVEKLQENAVGTSF